jgi:2-oxoglutarate dehydrogenase E1 component
MGAWFFVRRHLRDHLPEGMPFTHVTRPESASPATGSATVHEHEHEMLLRQAFDGLV